MNAGSANNTTLLSGATLIGASGVVSGATVGSGATLIVNDQIFGNVGDLTVPIVEAATIQSGGQFVDFFINAGTTTFYKTPAQTPYLVAQRTGSSISTTVLNNSFSLMRTLTQVTPTTFSDLVSANGGTNSKTFNGNIFEAPDISGVTVQSGGTYLFERSLDFSSQTAAGVSEAMPTVLAGGYEVIGGSFATFSDGQGNGALIW